MIRLLLLTSWVALMGFAQEALPLKVTVEVDEEVYAYVPPFNGADPFWCRGSTTLVQAGDAVFASGLETIPDAKPLHNVRPILFRRDTTGWKQIWRDEQYRTREPCPMGVFSDNTVLLSANPSLVPDQRSGPARPEVYAFAAAQPNRPPQVLLPRWDGKPEFREHTYRTFSVDRARSEFILFCNVGTNHSEWAFRAQNETWHGGQLAWMPRKDPDFAPYKSKFARANYPNVILANKAVHFCGASAHNQWDRVGPDRNAELSGRKSWGNRWRRLIYTTTPDITTKPFAPWLEIDNTFATGGWLFPGDMWLAPDGAVHIVWHRGPIHWKLGHDHFPDIKRITSLEYAVLRDGKISNRKTLVASDDRNGPVRAGMTVRFHPAPDGQLFIVYRMWGKEEGQDINRQQLMQILPAKTFGRSAPIPLKHPLINVFTTTPRAGSAPSPILHLFGHHRDGKRHTARYARVRISD